MEAVLWKFRSSTCVLFLCYVWLRASVYFEGIYPFLCPCCKPKGGRFGQFPSMKTVSDGTGRFDCSIFGQLAPQLGRSCSPAEHGAHRGVACFLEPDPNKRKVCPFGFRLNTQTIKYLKKRHTQTARHVWRYEAVGQNQWHHFGVSGFTTHFRTYFSWDWDVHWGYDLAFYPWPRGGQRDSECQPSPSQLSPWATKARLVRPGLRSRAQCG